MKKILATLLISSCFIFTAQAKGAAGGNGFRKAAVKYDVQAKNALRQGQRQIHQAYKRMADIKRNAAKLADQNKWNDIDWTEYHMLEKKISKLKQKQHAKSKDKK